MSESASDERSRRNLLRSGVSLAAVSLLGAGPATAQAQAPAGSPSGPPEHEEPHRDRGGERGETEISPTEDLMREHGVVTRVLLIYGEVQRRLEAGSRDFSPDLLKQSAQLVRSFVEDYHERLEEQHLFPRFKAAGVLVELADTLQVQHNAGRRVTDTIMSLATRSAFDDADERRRLIAALRAFIRMYLPHESREDTVLFPACHRLVSANEYDVLGEEFERRERQLFGEGGFFAIVDQVAGIEKQLGIHDLTQFTPES